MNIFTDKVGREWRVEVDVSAIRASRDRLGFNLGALADPRSKEFARFTGDIALQVDMLYLLCESQANDADVSDEQFGQAFNGDVLDAATEALLYALADFSRGPTGNRLRRAIEHSRDIVAMTDEKADRAMASINFSKRATDSPESSASTH